MPHELTLDELVERLATADHVVRQRYLTGAQIHDLRFRDADGHPVARYNGPAVYLWMRDALAPDEAEAIFVLASHGASDARSREEAFSTRDPKLIYALMGIFERYKLTASRTQAAHDAG